MTERPVTFTVASEDVRGILHLPDSQGDASPAAVILLHGWSGCRLGPHRMFVKMARRLAAGGWHCLRFDFRGRGESGGATTEAAIQAMIADARATVDFLVSETGIDHPVLLGICSGGKVAIGAATAEPRVQRLVLWSGEALGDMKSSATKARKTAFAFRDYLRKLTRVETWRKLVTLRVNAGLVRKAMFEHESADGDELRREQDILHRFESFKGEVLFVYGTNDPDTKLAAEGYVGFCKRHKIPHLFHRIEEANHSFYSLGWEKQVMDITEDWLLGRGRTE